MYKIILQISVSHFMYIIIYNELIIQQASFFREKVRFLYKLTAVLYINLYNTARL
jgi:hypothetical protein